MINKETAGIGKTTFKIILDKDWRKNTAQYVIGFDPYKKEDCVNLYNRFKKFLGLKYKVIESNSYAAFCKVKPDGTIKVVKYEK